MGRFSFTGYREVHDVMTANGDGAKGVWMTEIGWNTGSRKPSSCRDGAVAGTRAEGVSEKTQARFLSSPTAAWRPTRPCAWRCGSRCRTSAPAPATATTSG